MEKKQIVVELPVVSNWGVFAPERESVIIVGSALSYDIQVFFYKEHIYLFLIFH